MWIVQIVFQEVFRTCSTFHFHDGPFHGFLCEKQSMTLPFGKAQSYGGVGALNSRGVSNSFLAKCLGYLTCLLIISCWTPQNFNQGADFFFLTGFGLHLFGFTFNFRSTSQQRSAVDGVFNFIWANGSLLPQVADPSLGMDPENMSHQLSSDPVSVRSMPPSPRPSVALMATRRLRWIRDGRQLVFFFGKYPCYEYL